MITTKTKTARTDENMFIETTGESPHGSVHFVLTIRKPSMNSAKDLHDTILRRVKFVIEETLDGK